jgi:hypothetical protein
LALRGIATVSTPSSFVQPGETAAQRLGSTRRPGKPAWLPSFAVVGIAL